MELPLEELKEYQTKLREATLEEAEEILDGLKSISITFPQLKETKIGKTVRRVEKKYPSLQLKTKDLIEKWKALLPEKVVPRAPVRVGEKQECCISVLTKAVGNREVAEKIEAAMSQVLDGAKYDQKTRALRSNLQKNAVLREKVLSGEISCEELISMGPREMATTESQMQREKIEKDLTDSRRSDWLVANTKIEGSMYKCLKCKSDKTMSSQLQTRSADEPMTTKELKRIINTLEDRETISPLVKMISGHLDWEDLEEIVPGEAIEHLVEGLKSIDLKMLGRLEMFKICPGETQQFKNIQEYCLAHQRTKSRYLGFHINYSTALSMNFFRSISFGNKHWSIKSAVFKKGNYFIPMIYHNSSWVIRLVSGDLSFNSWERFLIACVELDLAPCLVFYSRKREINQTTSISNSYIKHLRNLNELIHTQNTNCYGNKKKKRQRKRLEDQLHREFKEETEMNEELANNSSDEECEETERSEVRPDDFKDIFGFISLCGHENEEEDEFYEEASENEESICKDRAPAIARILAEKTEGDKQEKRTKHCNRCSKPKYSGKNCKLCNKNRKLKQEIDDLQNLPADTSTNQKNLKKPKIVSLKENCHPDDKSSSECNYCRFFNKPNKLLCTNCSAPLH